MPYYKNGLPNTLPVRPLPKMAVQPAPKIPNEKSLRQGNEPLLELFVLEFILTLRFLKIFQTNPSLFIFLPRLSMLRLIFNFIHIHSGDVKAFYET